MYELIQNLPVEEVERKEETLSDYTKRLSEEKKEEEAVQNYYRVYDIKDKANFSSELDLHIEKLTNDPDGMSNSEKLNLQVQTFERYVEDAVEVGFERVFIIHGLGKGRLRDIVIG